MSGERPRAAFVYDFDGTLAPGNVPEHGLLPELDLEPRPFWEEVQRIAREQDSDEILVYMHRLLEEARAAGRDLTRASLAGHGRATPLFAGVEDWFARLDAHAASLGLELEHHVVSSGLLEMIEACTVASSFRHVFASRYLYDPEGRAVWPGVAVNYTTKTQYLFRIAKGVLNSWDRHAVNAWVPRAERPVPLERMVFFGDGETDIPSMKMVTSQGGHSIAVFSPAEWSRPDTQRKIHDLIADDRVDFVAPADYGPGTQLDVVAQGLLGRIANHLRAAPSA